MMLGGGAVPFVGTVCFANRFGFKAASIKRDLSVCILMSRHLLSVQVFFTDELCLLSPIFFFYHTCDIIDHPQLGNIIFCL